MGEALRSHVDKALTTVIAKYFANPTDATVVFRREGHNLRADIKVHVGRRIIAQSHAEGGDAYAAFDAAADHIAKRLRRQKRRLRNHHREKSEAEIARRIEQPEQVAAHTATSGAEESADRQRVIVADLETTIEQLTVGQAVERLDSAGLPAMMFRNSAHGGLNMIYLRPDGNIGWIDPPGDNENGPNET